MKPAGKVALLGLGALGLLTIIGRGSPTMGLWGLGMLFDRPQKISPEDEKRWQELRAKGQPIPAVMRAPDGSMVHVAPDGTVLGPVVSGNPRGQYSGVAH